MAYPISVMAMLVQPIIMRAAIVDVAIAAKMTAAAVIVAIAARRAAIPASEIAADGTQRPYWPHHWPKPARRAPPPAGPRAPPGAPPPPGPRRHTPAPRHRFTDGPRSTQEAVALALDRKGRRAEALNLLGKARRLRPGDPLIEQGFALLGVTS